ncbi:MAG: hypothetical protein K2O65_14715 [Lachnospiraceae bacterium]|nr:hypothetical protein [Lachnospiraceae bacterium]
MAQYDGSIRIGTGIDDKGFKAGSKELEAGARRLAKSVSDSLGEGAKIALQKQTDAFIKLNQQYANQEQKVINLASKLHDLQRQKVETDEFKELSKDLDKAKASLDRLYERRDSYKALGKETPPKLDLDISNAERKIRILEADIKELITTDKAYLPVDTSNVEQQIAEAEQKQMQMYSALQNAADTLGLKITQNVEKEEAKAKAIQEEAAEEERLAKIRENAVVGSQRIVKIAERRKQLLQESADMEAAGIGAGYQQYDSAKQEIAEIEQKIRDYNNGIKEAKENYKKLGDAVKKAFTAVGNMLKRANSLINSFGKRIKEAFSKFTKSASGATKSANGFTLSLKNILKYGFGIRSLYVLVNKLRSGIKEGFANLLTSSHLLENSVNGIKASALTLKNAFAAAFSPFVEIALPYVQKLLDYMIHLANVAGQFFAAITGRKTYIKAIKQTTEALKEETKEMNKQLSPLDKLNNLSSQKGTGADTGGAGAMFEEVPITSSILDMAEKIKDVLSKLFAPLKEAWEREGKFVMDSWKYALDEVWKLIKDIGRDFLTVWQQEGTIKIFEDLLHIIGDIGIVVGHLARNFRDAWNESQTGLRILENIRDIIGVIVHNIRLAADQTVEWADKLNFKPLLEAFERFTKSLIPLADALSGVLADFYTKVLLPLAKWTVEKGLPELLDVFTAFNEKVDWQALRDNLAEFWEHLEPFAETIGEGLIIFIERVSNALADFVNSQEFKDFLVTLENWMDSVSPEDVADALEMIAKGLIALKLALIGFSGLKGVSEIFTTIKSILPLLSILGGGIMTTVKILGIALSAIVAKLAPIAVAIKTFIASTFSLGAAISGLITAFAAVSAAVFGWNVGSLIAEKLDLDPKPFKETMSEIKSSFTDGSWKEALKLWGEDIKAAWTEIWGYVKEDFENSILGGVLVSFTDGTWKEAMSLWGNDIYSAFVTLGQRQVEWLNSLKNKWLQTWNNIKAGISGVIASIKSSVGSALDWIGSKLKSLQSAFSSIGSGFSGSGGLFGKSRSSATTYSMQSPSPYALNPAFAALQTADFPAYATGQVIPTSMKQHLAWLGDNKRETEVVSPLSTIEEAVINAMAKVNGNNGNNGGSQEINLNLTVECEGYRLIQLMQKLNGEYFKQNGKYAFT